MRVNCELCGIEFEAFKNNNFPVCKNCKRIDREERHAIELMEEKIKESEDKYEC